MTDERDLVRQQSFDCDGPVDIDVELGSGSIEIQLAEGPAADDTVDDGTEGDDSRTVMVEVRHDPQAGSNWGLAGLLSWFNVQFATMTPDLAAEAVRQTTISMAGNRVTVRGPRTMPLRTVPLAIVVHAPAGSSPSAKAGAARVRIGGPAARVQADTGSGDISVDRAAGPVQIKTGSGAVHLGPMPDGLSARTGSGDLEVTSLAGGGSVHSGSGNIWIGTVAGSSGLDDRVTVKTGSGDLTVADAAGGVLEVITGSGDLRIGIRSGVLAEVDVLSGSGRARSDLPVSTEPPSEGEAVLAVRARTGSGDAVVGPATA